MAGRDDTPTGGRGDEPTGRTQMAQDAINEAYKAQSSVLDVRRSVKRLKGVWGTLTVIALIAGAGFGVATYLKQFETVEHVKTMSVSIEESKTEMAEIRGTNRSLNSRIDRIEDKVDKRLERLEDKLDRLLRGK